MGSDSEIQIIQLDPVYCRIRQGKNLLLPCLSYKYTFYKQSKFRKIAINSQKRLIDGKGLFYAGFLNRVEKFCLSNGISLSIDRSKIETLPPLSIQPELNGISFEGKWAFQAGLISLAIEKQKGVIKSATASGKTIIMLGILSRFPKAKVLFLSDMHTPISQFKEALVNQNSFLGNQIDISTVQVMSRRTKEEIINKDYDIILVDECHLVSSFDGMYAKVLSSSLAPIRLGFTATLPDSEKGRLALEGLLGPVIGEYTIQEGTEDRVLAKPQILLEMVPENSSLKILRKYKDVYKVGVVENRSLNRMIVKHAKEASDRGMTCLILVVEIAHGQNIVEMGKWLYDLDIVFAQGKTEPEIREQIRDGMKKKETKVVVATAVFRKALNIPSLDMVINACGGKSEVMTLQAIGRGLRATGEKSRVIIRDFFNPSNHYLIKHFGYRLSLYFREGWLGREEK